MKYPNFAECAILVVGDIMLDKYIMGSVKRISPEAPVPILEASSKQVRVGGAGNVAMNCASIGCNTYLQALIGSDENGQLLEDLLSVENINSNLQKVANSKTLTKTRLVALSQHLIRLDSEDSFDQWDPISFVKRFSDTSKHVETIVFSDYAKGALRHISTLIEIARKSNKKVLVDPKGTDFARYSGAHVITPNLAEFEAVVGKCESVSDIESKAQSLMDRLSIEHVLVTRSEKGMSLLSNDSPPLHLSTKAVDVFDVTGAGDTVIATLAASLTAGMPLYAAVELANYAAGIVVSKAGTTAVSKREISDYFKTNDHIADASYDNESILNILTSERSLGKTLIMTNGCFDILHAGHIDYLEKAKNLGDILVVAVNDDKSIRRIKGKERPINPLRDRIRMLESLSFVDYVLSFSEDTPLNLISSIQPDILVKGGDYRINDIVGKDIVERAGGKVQTLPLLSGYSTSSIIEKIRQINR